MGTHLTTLIREGISENSASSGEARQELSGLLGEARDYVKAEVERVRNETNARVIRLYERNDEFRDSQRELSDRVTELTQVYNLIQQRISNLEQQMVQDTLMNGVQTEILEPTQGSSRGMQQPSFGKAFAAAPRNGQRTQCRCCGKMLAKNYVRIHEKMHCPILKYMNPESSTVTGSSRMASPVDHL